MLLLLSLIAQPLNSSKPIQKRISVNPRGPQRASAHQLLHICNNGSWNEDAYTNGE